MDNMKELLIERRKVVEQMRGMVNAAEAEKRDFTAEEQVAYDKMLKDVDGLKARCDRLEKQKALDDDLNTRMNEPIDTGMSRGGKKDARSIIEVVKRSGIQAVSTEELEAARSVIAREYMLTGEKDKSETRALQMDSDIYGGYMTLPQQMKSGLLMAMDNLTFIRQRATVTQVPTAESLGIVSLDNDPGDATWTSEILTGSADSTMSVGKRELFPHPLARRILVSNKLMRATAGGAESLVIQRLSYKFAVVEENAFLNGTGNMQPLGMMVASANGITTARDVSDGNTATTITWDGLKNAKYSVKSQYWPRCVWIWHRDSLKMLSKIKNDNGYVWQPSVQVGQPDMMEGFPFLTSEYQLNTFTASQYVGLFGDLSHYQIADAMTQSIQRLNELYAETNQVGFIGRLECDGMPDLAEAFARVKLTA
jgi:HK97 family phage major capsid protein